MLSLYLVQNLSQQCSNTAPPPPFSKLRGLRLLINRNSSSFSFFYIRLAALTFCLFLGACGGKSDSTSTDTNSSSGEDEKVLTEDCKVENGVAELNNDKCEVIACNAGYDDYDTDNDCEETPEGHYSPEDSKQRIACIKPTDSSWASGTGLASADDCEWACDAGHDNSQNENVCAETAVGYYSLVASNDRMACTKPTDSSWTSSTIGLSSVGECASLTWACDAGHDNSQNANVCAETAVGFYSLVASNERTACTKPTDSSWASSTTGLSSVGECASLTWACDAGHDNSQNANVCAETAAGFYSPAATNGRTACTKPTDSSWRSGTGLAAVNECAWACDAGHDSSQNANVCAETAAGFYSPAATNGRTACTKPTDSSWTSGTGLAAANECAWACDAGHDNSQNANVCAETAIGFYSPAATNGRTACTKPTDSSWTSGTGLVAANECAWACDAGHDNSQNANVCAETAIGFYSPATTNDRTACIKPNDSSWTSGTGLVAANECAWACDSGHDNSQNRNVCAETVVGYYSPAASNNRAACTKPADSSWTSSTIGLSSVGECASLTWACDAGHDNSQNRNVCAETAIGFYSPATTNDRTACTKPNDSSWTSGTGLAAANECAWACDAGHDNSQTANVCAETAIGYYSPATTNDRTACTKPTDSSWTSGTGLAAANECAWACDAGHDNSQNANVCAETSVGYYSPATTNDRTACTKPNDSSWTSGTGLAAANECAWACDAGHDNSQNANVCAETAVGYYSPSATNDRTACTKPADSSWTSGTGLAAANECAWACDAGHDNSQTANACAETAVGYYSPSATNDRTACTKSADSSWTSGTGLAAANECTWACDAGHDNSQNANACAETAVGYYSPAASNDRTACTKPTDSSWTSSTTGLSSVGECVSLTWACDAGHDNSQTANMCAETAIGYYSPAANNDRTACTKPADSSWTTTTGLNSIDDCNTQAWSCDSGHYKSRNRNVCVKVNVAIATGISYACAILDDDGDVSNGGPVKCWGRSYKGIAYISLKATHISAGHSHVCAILADKSVKCWGSNSKGQTGGGTSSSTETASGTEGYPLTWGEEATHITAGDGHTCVILSDKSVISAGGIIFMARQEEAVQ